MQITQIDRERHLLKMILKFPVIRYLLTHSRNEYGERVDWHIRISKLICHWLSASGGVETIRHLNDEYPEGWHEVHDWIAYNITDCLDEVLGWPLGRKVYGDEIEKFADMFIDFIWLHMCELMKVIEQAKR